MKKIVLILSLVIGLFANESLVSENSKMKGLRTYNSQKSAWNKFNRICIDGVVYVSFSRFLSVWVNPNTMKFQKCEMD